MSTMTSFRLRDRTTAARWILATAFLLLSGTFFRTQVLDYERYRLRAESNRLRPVPLVAPRGAILDRNGLIIADNVPGWAVKLFAISKDSLRAALHRLGELVALDSATVKDVMRRFGDAPYEPALVLGNASTEVIARLEEHRLSFPGLVIQTEPRRVYPAGKAVGHVVGYVGEVSEDDLDKDRYPGAKSGTLVGREGLELQYDHTLRGIEGVRYIEVNARGRMVREEVSSPSLSPISGEAIKTTLDLPLQIFIDSLWSDSLPRTRGAMVALTPEGEILALYSAPGFDPNDFIGGIVPAKWNALISDEAKPLLNRAIKGSYPPASPFKLAIATMALRRGLINFDSRMAEPCRGGLQYGNRFFGCWKKQGHGYLNLTGAIANSCDVYFYQLGLKLGLTAILQDGALLGFRDKAGVDLRGEQAPIFPASVAYYNKRYGARGWSNAVTLNLAIGQGEDAQTLISMVKFYQALAGEGKVAAPHLVRPTKEGAARDLGLTRSQLEGLRAAMVQVVASGTAAASGGRELKMAGKTGTAQNSTGANHGWFIGFAPYDHPKIIVGSIMESLGGHGGAYVAPWVARVIRRYLQETDPSLRKANIRLVVPEDSAPQSVELPADSTGAVP